MRIAYVCADPGIPVFGTKGASVHVQEVVRALCRRGADVTLFATRFGGDAPDDLADIGVVELPPVAKGPLGARERRAFRANAVLTGELDQCGPFDLVYERYSLWSVAGVGYARATGTPSLVEVNAPLIEEQAVHRGLENRAGAERVARTVFASATAVLAVSAEVAAWVAANAPSSARIEVVPNAVDPDRFAPVADRGHDPGRFTVGFVGTLKPWHGVETLLAAAARTRAAIPELSLLVVGDGPERQALQAQAVALGLDGITRFEGAVDPAAVPALLAQMDVAAAPYPPSDDCYFSPLKVFEYLAAGLPTVASAVGQIPQILTDGRTGVLCRPGDAQDLAAALVDLHANPARRLALGRVGRAHVVAHHTWDAVAARILGFATRPLVGA